MGVYPLSAYFHIQLFDLVRIKVVLIGRHVVLRVILIPILRGTAQHGITLCEELFQVLVVDGLSELHAFKLTFEVEATQRTSLSLVQIVTCKPHAYHLIAMHVGTRPIGILIGTVTDLSLSQGAFQIVDPSTDRLLLFHFILVSSENFLYPLKVALLNAKHAGDLLDIKVMSRVSTLQLTGMEAVATLVGLAKHAVAGHVAHSTHIVEELTFEVILSRRLYPMLNVSRVCSQLIHQDKREITGASDAAKLGCFGKAFTVSLASEVKIWLRFKSSIHSKRHDVL